MESVTSLINQSVKSGGIHIPVSFVEKTASGSGGCFIPDEFRIEISMETIEEEFEEAKKNGLELISPMHLLDIVLAHELGHAYDEMKTNRIKTAFEHYKKATAAAVSMDFKGLASNYRKYANMHYQCEVQAWKHSERFRILKHDKTQVKKRIDSSLRSYQESYSSEYKFLHMVRRFIEKLQQEIRFPGQVSFDINIHNKGKNHFDKDKNILFMDFRKLLHWKPEINVRRDDYILLHTLYTFVSETQFDKSLDQKLGELYSVVFQKTYDSFEEIDEKLSKIYCIKKKETINAFASIEKMMKTKNNTVQIYKEYQLTYLKNDIEKSRNFFRQTIKRHLNCTA